MEFSTKLKDELLQGDFRTEDEDEYVKKIKADNKRDKIIKISMGAFYITLLIVSLFII
jgi:hypothetical protein